MATPILGHCDLLLQPCGSRVPQQCSGNCLVLNFRKKRTELRYYRTERFKEGSPPHVQPPWRPGQALTESPGLDFLCSLSGFGCRKLPLAAQLKGLEMPEGPSQIVAQTAHLRSWWLSVALPCPVIGLVPPTGIQKLVIIAPSQKLPGAKNQLSHQGL